MKSQRLPLRADLPFVPGKPASKTIIPICHQWHQGFSRFSIPGRWRLFRDAQVSTIHPTGFGLEDPFL